MLESFVYQVILSFNPPSSFFLFCSFYILFFISIPFPFENKAVQRRILSKESKNSIYYIQFKNIGRVKADFVKILSVGHNTGMY